MNALANRSTALSAKIAHGFHHLFRDFFSDEDGVVDRHQATAPVAVSPRVADLTIDMLQIKNRTLHCLERAGLILVVDVVRKSPEQLLKLHGFGRQSLADLTEALSRLGYVLRDTRV